jgi:hypothetical protein
VYLNFTRLFMTASTPPLPEPDQASESSPHRRPPSRCVLRSQQESVQHVDSSRNLRQRHRLTNPEFHELTAAMFGLPSRICKQHYGAQINKANQNKTVDLYGDNVKSAASFPGSHACQPGNSQCSRERSSKRAHHAQNRHRRFQWSS